ncbi:MAG: hypothetical protein ABI690_07115 [Chloroflexota bacterium]
MSNQTSILSKRDSKTKPHLSQYAPVWLEEQQIIPDDEAVLFNVIFEHKDYGWVNRKYRYDGFNNVLYYRGQLSISEEKAVAVQNQEPYIPTLLNDVPNSYGG